MHNQVYNSFYAHSTTQRNINVVKTIDGKRTGVTFDFTKPLTFARCDEVVLKLREFLNDDTINGFTASRSVWQFEEDEEYVKNYPFLEELASTETSEIIIKYTQNAYNNDTRTFGHKEIQAHDTKRDGFFVYIHSGDDAETIANNEINESIVDFADKKVAEFLAKQQVKREAFERELAEKGETVHHTEKEWNDLWREKTSQTSDNTGFDWSNWNFEAEEFAKIDDKEA